MIALAFNIDKLVPLADPVSGVVKSVGDNISKVKISNNELVGKISDNKLAAYQTYSNNSLAKFTNAVAAMQNIVSCISSAISAGVDAYAKIQVSHDQVRITQAQATAFIQGKREDTEQLRIMQQAETIRSLANLNSELETKKLEFTKFENELAENRKTREFNQEKWRRKVDAFEKYFNPLLDYAKKIRDKYYESNFENEKLRDEIRRLDESITVYLTKINDIYQ